MAKTNGRALIRATNEYITFKIKRVGHRGSTGDSLFLQIWCCCLTSQGSPTAMQHVVSVDSSSLILYSTL